MKLQSFALAGGLAGLGGALLAGAFANIAFTENFFLVNDSLNLVAMVVIGGMGSVSGAVIGAIFVIGIPAIAPNNQLVGLLSSSLGLLVVLLYFPRGLNQITYGVRDAILSWADRRVGRRRRRSVRPTRPPCGSERRSWSRLLDPTLAVADLSVHFGGIAAVDKATLSVGSGEIVGLIGANGAGKSTLMNAIGGFVRSTGSVSLLGEEVAGQSPGYRASLGLGRTFQAATLFPELTVNETLLVALEAKGRATMLSTALGLPRARRHSRAALSEVSELVGFLGLEPLSRSLRERSLHRDATRGRAGRPSGAQRQGALPRRAHGRVGAAGDGGLRSTDPHDPKGARGVGAPHRARHASRSWASRSGCTASRPVT